MKRIVTIITDGGIDDIFALAFLSRRQDVKIRQVIAVPGNGSSQRAYSNILYFLPELKDQLLTWEPETPNGECEELKIHGIGGLGDIDIPLQNGPSFAPQTFNLSRTELLLSLAPLTLLAILAENQPSNNFSPGNTIIMGGAVENGIGNDTPYAEYNFLKDPDAAKKVIHSCVYPTIIPLDVTRSITFGEELETVLHENFLDIFKFLRKKYLKLGQATAPIHDLIAVCFCVAPDAFMIRHRYASIVNRDPGCSGCLLLDQHMYTRKSPNCFITSAAEETRIKFEVITTLSVDKNERI